MIAITQVTEIPLNKIIPDEEQPRKEFDSRRLNELANSIKQHGILNPIVVEEMGDGKFLLVDGERRFRASQLVPLNKVPAIVQPASSSRAERLIRQFHLQEQHQEWSATEKANAIEFLAQETGMGVIDLARQLSLPNQTISRYKAYFSLANRELFARRKLSLEWASHVGRLVKAAKNVALNHLGAPLEREQLKKIEEIVVEDIASGRIENLKDITRINDSFRHKPEMIERFINREVSSERIFSESDADKERIARNVIQLSNLLASFIRDLDSKDALDTLLARDSHQLAALKSNLKMIAELSKRV